MHAHTGVASLARGPCVLKGKLHFSFLGDSLGKLIYYKSALVPLCEYEVGFEYLLESTITTGIQRYTASSYGCSEPLCHDTSLLCYLLVSKTLSCDQDSSTIIKQPDFLILIILVV